MKHALVVLIALLALVSASVATAHVGRPAVSEENAQNWVKSKYEIDGVICGGHQSQLSHRFKGIAQYRHVACASYNGPNLYCFTFHPLSKTTFKVTYFKCPRGITNPNSTSTGGAAY